MLDCRRIDRLLSRLVDGETSPSEEEVVRKHLAACPACEERFRAFQKDSFQLQQFYDGTPVPEGIADGVLARALAESAAAPVPGARIPFLRRLPALSAGAPSARLKWLLAVAAMLLVALLAQWMRQPDTSQWNEGIISYVKPPVMRQLPGSDTWSELTGSGFLLPGGSLQVWQGGLVQVDYQGRGSVLANSRSTLRAEGPAESAATALTLAQGEAFIEFLHARSAILLKTPAGQVLGSNAAANVRIVEPGGNVSFWDGILPDWPRSAPFRLSLFELLPVADAVSAGTKVIVTTKTGVVEVRNERGSQRVFAGTQVTLAPGSPPGRQEPANLGQVLQWTRGKREEVVWATPRRTTSGPGTATPVEPLFRDPDPGVEAAAPTARSTPGPAAEVAPDFLPDATDPKPLRLFPPVIVEATPEVGKITLRWIDDGATTYPVVGYDVYRTSLEPETEPRRLNVSPVPVTRLEGGATGGTYVDSSIVGDARYGYHVRALASRDSQTPPPPASQRTDLLESPASAGTEVKASRDFILTLTGWSEKPEKTAHILVQKWHNGRPLGHVFQARVGDSIGRILDVRLGGLGSKPDIETVDFSTGCTLIDLRQVRRAVPGGIVPGNVVRPLTLPSQTAVLLGPDGKTIELSRYP